MFTDIWYWGHILEKIKYTKIGKDDQFRNVVHLKNETFIDQNHIISFFSGSDLDHVTYGLWCTKILINCSKSFKIAEVLVLILRFLFKPVTYYRKSFLNLPLFPVHSFCLQLFFYIIWYFLMNKMIIIFLFFFLLINLNSFNLSTLS